MQESFSSLLDPSKGLSKFPSFSIHTLPEADSFESRVRALICAHLLDKAFSVHVLAGMLYMSYSTLNRKLQKEAQISPHQLIRAIRLETAAQLLMTKSCKISDIAYGVGFNSLSYFTRSFHAHFGIPPSQYRKRILASRKLPRAA